MKIYLYALIVCISVLIAPTRSLAKVVKITLTESGTLTNYTNKDEAKEADSLIICGNVELSSSDFLGIKKLLVSYKLKYVDIYDTSNTTIGEEIFYGCKNLTGFKFPQNMKSVGRYCFEACNNLENITLPKSLEFFGVGAFRSCGIKEVTIPENVTRIDNQTFLYCPLQNVYSEAKTPPSCTVKAFAINNNNEIFATLHVPSGTKELYENADGWMYFPITTESNKEMMKIGYSVNGNGKIKINDITYRDENVTYIEKNSDINIEIIPDPGNIIAEVYYIVNNSMGFIDIFNDAKDGFYTYKSVEDNINFYFIFEEDDSSKQRCATPVISYSNGELIFSCETEGAECTYNIKSPDVTYDGNFYQNMKLPLYAYYDIVCEATAEGYTKSDIATAKLYWLPTDGTLETNINPVETRGVMATSSDGFITLSGLNDNEQVSFYSADGKELGTVSAIDGTAQFSAQSGSVVIAKIGKESVKIAVK